MKTFSAKAHSVEREWFVVDATDKNLGRLAAELAKRLRGKHKPIFTPHVDVGDYIVVTNIDKVAISGKKREDKVYHRHSGYPGGLKTISFDKLLDKSPKKVLEYAVAGMLPKNSLGRAMIKKLKIYAGTEHPHAAQNPAELIIN